MSTEFLYAANLLMLGRLYYIRQDEPISLGRAAISTAVQWVFLLVLNPTPVWLVLIASLATINLAPYLLEKRYPYNSDGLRFSVLLLTLLIFNILFSHPLNPGFNADLSRVMQQMGQYTLLFPNLDPVKLTHGMAILFGLLLLANEVNHLIRYLLGLFELAPRKEPQQDSPEDEDTLAVNQQEYNAGRLIGTLERILIFFFVLADQFTAIAFIIAAKGFARFKELDQRQFAEYVLIGTLMSVVLAIISANLVKQMLN